MQLTVLVDNNTYIDKYYIGEPALSYLIDFEGHRILFDAGYSKAFLENAKKMNIDLNTVTEVVISHGHDDHTRGLQFLTEILEGAPRPLIAHPDCFNPKHNEAGDYNGAPYSTADIRSHFQFIATKEPYRISDHCLFLGEIPVTVPFEARKKIGSVVLDGETVDDYAYDDSALVFETEHGLVIVTGCSHSGICNIINHAKKVCSSEKIAAVIGGFHLLEADDRLKQTITFLDDANIASLYPCHCISLHAKCAMNQVFDINEVGVGMIAEFK